MICELRQYTLHPGMRDTLIELFEREFVEGQEEVGMTLVGTFCDADDPDRFIWIRAFPDMDTRRAALEAFYYGPIWKAHSHEANATMIDSDNVLLLHDLPTPQRDTDHPTAPLSHDALGPVSLEADQQESDGRDPHQQGSDGREPDRHGPEDREPDRFGSEDREPDQFGSEGLSPDRQGSDGREPHQHGPEGLCPDADTARGHDDARTASPGRPDQAFRYEAFVYQAGEVADRAIAAAGGSLVACYESHHAVNTFPGLPVREGENVVVLLTRGTAELPTPTQHLRLIPTPRSALR